MGVSKELSLPTITCMLVGTLLNGTICKTRFDFPFSFSVKFVSCAITLVFFCFAGDTEAAYEEKLYSFYFKFKG